MSSLRLYLAFLAGAAVMAASGTVHWVRSHRKSPEQREYERRQHLNSSGRITDGTVLEFRELKEDGHSPLQFLLYAYDVGGVSYECSQEVSQLRQAVDLSRCRIGLPASIKYDPQNPANSIVVAEGWIGLRR